MSTIEQIIEEFELLCDDFDSPITLIPPEKDGSGTPQYTTLREKLRSSLQKMYETGRNDRVPSEGEIPMGVSQWREHGKKFGYWDAFRSSVIEECVEVVEKKRVTMNIFGESDEKNDGIVMGLEIAKEELTRLNSLKEKTQ